MRSQLRNASLAFHNHAKYTYHSDKKTWQNVPSGANECFT